MRQAHFPGVEGTGPMAIVVARGNPRVALCRRMTDLPSMDCFGEVQRLCQSETHQLVIRPTRSLSRQPGSGADCPLGYAELGTTRPAWGVAGTPASPSRNPGAHMKGSSLPAEPWRDGTRLRPTGAVQSESCRSRPRTTTELTPMSRPDVAKIGPPLPPMVAHVAVRTDTPPFERADGPTFSGVARNPRSRKR